MQQTKLFTRAALCALAYLAPVHAAAEEDAQSHPHQAAVLEQEHEHECHIAAFVEKLDSGELSDHEGARGPKEKPRHHDIFEVAAFVCQIEKGLIKQKEIKRDINRHNQKLGGMRKRRRGGQIRKPIDCKKDTPAIYAACNNKKVALKALIQHGADLDKKNADGLTPLMGAAASGYLRCVQLLVAASADLNAEDNQGQTALMHAKKAKVTKRSKALVALLIEATREPEEVDVDADLSLELTWV